MRIWAFPVPVRPDAGWKAQRPEHAAFGIETDLDRLGPYSDNRALTADEDLLWVDHQAPLTGHGWGRLGAGRAGVFRGKYLKGIGRTPAAGNWNTADRLHNSGHLPVSAAVRERLTSVYLEALGLGGAVVACEGILVRALAPELARFRELALGSAAAEPPVNLRMQAISVKAGGFFRWANLGWWLGHAGSRANGSLLELHALLGPAAFLAGVERALGHFTSCFRAGVGWLSTENNTTHDGRFLDLESGVIVGGPGVAQLEAGGAATATFPGAAPAVVTGTEYLFFAREAALYAHRIADALAFHARHGLSGGLPARGALEAAAEAWRALTDTSGHWLFSRDGVVETVLGMTRHEAALDPDAAAHVAAFLAAEYDMIAAGRAYPLAPRLLPCAAGLPRVRAGEALWLALFPLSATAARGFDAEVMRAVAAAEAQTDAATTPDELFAALAAAERRVADAAKLRRAGR